MSEHVTIELPEPMVVALREAVNAGAYASTDAAIQDALQLWLERRTNDIDRLRDAWDEGKRSGRHGPLDFEELRREARQRLAAVAEHDD